MKVLNRLIRSGLLFVLVAGGLASAQDVAQESQTDVMRRLVDEVYTGESYELLATAFRPEFAWVGPGPQETLLDDWRAEVEALNAALPDLRGETIELISGADWVAHLLRMSGTFTAPLEWRGETFAPNGETVAWLQLDMIHFLDEGPAGFGFSERDTLALKAQLGAAGSGSRHNQPAQTASTAAPGQAIQPAPAQAGLAVTTVTREDEDRFRRTLDDFLEAAVETPDSAVFAPSFSDDFALHWPASDGTLADLAALLAAVKVAMPDATSEAMVIVDDDYAAVRLGLPGTFLGPWTNAAGVDLSPTGERLYLTANLLVHFDTEARIDALWFIYDRENWDAQFAAPVAPVS